MSNMNRRNWLAAVLPSDNPKRKFSATSSRERIRQKYFPNVELVTHEGKKVKLYDDLLKDKIVVINFMYANCEGICPTVQANMMKVYKKLGDRMGRDIFFYSFTLQPEKDTPEVLKAYAEMHGGGNAKGWLYLTGKPQDIETVRRKLGFTDPDPEVDADKSSHIGNLRYGNEALQLWAACPGMADPNWIHSSILWADWTDDRQAKQGGRK